MKLAPGNGGSVFGGLSLVGGFCVVMEQEGDVFLPSLRVLGDGIFFLGLVVGRGGTVTTEEL